MIPVRLFGEARKNVSVVDDAILEDFDKSRALMGMGGLQHVHQLLRHINRTGNKAGPGPQRKCARLGGVVD